MKPIKIRIAPDVYQTIHWHGFDAMGDTPTHIEAELDLNPDRSGVYERVPIDARAPLDDLQAKIEIGVEVRVNHGEGKLGLPNGKIVLQYRYEWRITLVERRQRYAEATQQHTELYGSGMLSDCDLSRAMTESVEDLQAGLIRADAIARLLLNRDLP